jgi:hypothetical protein
VGGWGEGGNKGLNVTWIAAQGTTQCHLKVQDNDAPTEEGRDDDDEASSATVMVAPVHVHHIEYQDPIEGWIGVADWEMEEGELYVPLGARCSFRACHNPNVEGWPAGKPTWGGTAEGETNGDTRDVTLTTMDPKTISASCGNTITVTLKPVRISALQYDHPVNGWTMISVPGTPGTLAIPVGSTMTFRAVRDPVGEDWPSGCPVWTLGEVWLDLGEDPAVQEIEFEEAGDFDLTAACGSALVAHLRVVRVQSIAYEDFPGHWRTIADYPDSTETLVVGKGETVTFKAVAYPNGASWPDGFPTWGGAAQGAPPGETAQVTFNATGDQPVSATVGTSTRTTPVKVTRVLAIGWEKFDQTNLELETDTYGIRIFPDKKTYNDQEPAKRQNVTVVATVSPAVAGAKVYFSWWDPDDPTLGLPFDFTDIGGKMLGPDNYDTGAGFGTRKDTEAVTILENGQANARTVFTVSMAPGDNFVIAASTNKARMQQITQEMIDGYEAMPADVETSVKLYVWRKLHVEVDMMQGDISDTNLVENSPILRQRTDDGFTYLKVQVPDDFDTPDKFVGGWIHVAGQDDPWPVEGFDSVEKEVKIQGEKPSVEDCAYRLWDDDYDSRPVMKVFPFPRRPNCALLASRLEKAFIKVVLYEDTETENIGFRRNLHPDDDQQRDVRETIRSDFQFKDYVCSSFWAVHLVSAYQRYPSEDCDPNRGTAVLGSARWQEHGCLTYLETQRDFCEVVQRDLEQTEKLNVVHEVGHCLSALDSDGGLYDHSDIWYSKTSLWKIRFFGLRTQ